MIPKLLVISCWVFPQVEVVVKRIRVVCQAIRSVDQTGVAFVDEFGGVAGAKKRVVDDQSLAIS